jgi:Domain of Unknown Function (DUF1080)
VRKRYSNLFIVARFVFARTNRMRTLVFCLLLALVSPVTAAEIHFDFGNYSGDHGLTNDFSSALAGGGRPGDWQTVMDEVPSILAPISSNTPPAMNHIPVLAQLDTDPTDNRFPMLVYDKETFKDFQIKTRFKIVEGMQEQMAGVVFRFQNPSNFYVIRISALGHNLRFYKYVNGQFVDPATVNADISTDRWHTLTVQSEGNQINCWLDDKLAMPLETSMTFPPGKVGFWTMSDSLTHYGDTSIIYKPTIPMVQLLIQNVLQQEPRLLGLRIYMLDKDGIPHIIASKDSKEVGQAGTKSEQGAINKGAIYFGRGTGTVAVTMPLDDRNGNPIAAVRVQTESFFGETQDTAILRARVIVQMMQAQIMSSQDLAQ